MADFAPPAGPPPPKAPEVPAGWTARWNDQYKEWFYVNLYTKQSQWDKPTTAVYPPGEAPPDGAPPGYTPSDTATPTDTKKNPYEDTSKTNLTGGGSSVAGQSEDEKLARELQAQEEARARGQQSSVSPYPDQLPPRPQQDRGKSGSGGLFGKLLGKASSKMGGSGQSGAYPGGHGAYPQQQGYYPQQPQYGYPQQQQYYPQQQPYGYGHQPQYGYGGHGGGYGGQGAYGKKPGGGGMGMAGGAALGLGAGLIGGALVANAIDNAHDEAYMDGYQDGQDGDFGGDFE